MIRRFVEDSISGPQGFHQRAVKQFMTQILRTCALSFGAIILLVAQRASAAQFYIMEATAEGGVTDDQAMAMTSFVRNSITTSGSGDTVTSDRNKADFILQPRLMKMGNSFIITVEKKRGSDTLFAAQSKAAREEDIDRATRRATLIAAGEPTATRSGSTSMRSSQANQQQEQPMAPYQGQQAQGQPTRQQSGAGNEVVVIREPAQSSQVQAAPAPAGAAAQSKASADAWPVQRKVGYASIGVGPFIGRRLGTDDVMYNAMFGYNWDIHPRATIKAIAEGSLSSGRERARFYNAGVGANWYFNGATDDSPYVTADFGYGYAEDVNKQSAEGFSFGTGIGYRFFRLTETTLDVLLRYNTVADTIAGGGNPSVVGIRLAVNF
jgi:hypothetical protein